MRSTILRKAPLTHLSGLLAGIQRKTRARHRHHLYPALRPVLRPAVCTAFAVASASVMAAHPQAIDTQPAKPVSPAAEVHGARVRVIAVQMKTDISLYRDLPTFRAAMDTLLADAARRKAKTCPTLVALPEDVGLGLIFLGQWDTVGRATTIREAGALLGQKMAAAVGANVVLYGVSQNRAILLAANDEWLRDAYFTTFSELAKKYGVYLAAGSAPLRKVGTGEVYNTAVLFGPDGAVLNESRKVHLIDLEGPAGLDLTPGRLEDLTVAETPFGKIGTAICYDGFHDDVLDHLAQAGATLIMQPSFNPSPWTAQQEADWSTGLWQKVKTRSGIAAGINPMMVGSLWDIVPEGRTNIVSSTGPANGYLARAESPTSPTMVVVDLPYQP